MFHLEFIALSESVLYIAHCEAFLDQACLLNIFKKLKAKKTQPPKKLKGIFGQKTQ